MNLPETLEYIMKKIMDAGGQVYLVGGALRDRLLGKPVTDYDLASSFPPDRIRNFLCREDLAQRETLRHCYGDEK